MKLLCLLLTTALMPFSFSADKKIWEMTAEEYCSQGNGKIENGSCVFPESYSKGDEVINLINKALEIKVGENYVLEGNAMDCLVQWSTSGVTNYSDFSVEPVYGELVFINLDESKTYQSGPKKGEKIGVGVPLDRFWVAKDITYKTQSVDFGIESENGFYIETSIQVAGSDKYTMSINAEGDAAFGLLFLRNAQGEKLSLEQYCELEF